jgi:serine/threonine protein kinase
MPPDGKQIEEIQTLSTGRFGVVRIVRHRADNRIYAIKSFSPYKPTQGNEGIEEEIKHLKSLSHPCILPIIRWERPRNGIGSVTRTEYEANGSLEDVLKDVEMQGNCSVLTRTRITIMTIRLVVGMNYLHKSSVIHGLMKPSDILIDDNYRSWISDFVTMRMGKLKAIRASQVSSP